MRRRERDWFRPRGPREQAPVRCVHASISCSAVPGSHSFHAIISMAGRCGPLVDKLCGSKHVQTHTLFVYFLVYWSRSVAGRRPHVTLKYAGTKRPLVRITRQSRNGTVCLFRKALCCKFLAAPRWRPHARCARFRTSKGFALAARSCSGRCAGIADSAACRSITRPFTGGSRSRRQRSRSDCAGTGVGRAQ